MEYSFRKLDGINRENLIRAYTYELNNVEVHYLKWTREESQGLKPGKSIQSIGWGQKITRQS